MPPPALSQVPSSRRLRKYHQTVPQGGPPRADGYSASGGPAYATKQDVQDAVHDIETSRWFWAGLFPCQEATEEPIPPNGYRSNCLPKDSCLSRPRNDCLVPRITGAPFLKLLRKPCATAGMSYRLSIAVKTMSDNGLPRRPGNTKSDDNSASSSACRSTSIDRLDSGT